MGATNVYQGGELDLHSSDRRSSNLMRRTAQTRNDIHRRGSPEGATITLGMKTGDEKNFFARCWSRILLESLYLQTTIDNWIDFEGSFPC